MPEFPTTGRVYSKAWSARGVEGAIKWEVIHVTNGATVTLTFESAADQGQGVWLASNAGFTLDGVQYEQLVLWEHTAPRQVKLSVHCTDGLLHLYNVWADPSCAGGMGSQSYSSAMLQEKLPHGFRYRCNDIGFNEKFERLVFRIEAEA